MEKRFLNDTSILIYFLKDEIPLPALARHGFLSSEPFFISVISQIEFLGWDGFSPEQFELARSFLDGAKIIPIDEDIVTQAIQLRRNSKIKLPDAVIAATCIARGMILVTRNEKDFRNISELQVLNPFSEITAG